MPLHILGHSFYIRIVQTDKDREKNCNKVAGEILKVIHNYPLVFLGFQPFLSWVQNFALAGEECMKVAPDHCRGHS